MPININDLRDAAETLLTASKNKLEKVKKSNNILANAQTEQLQELTNFITITLLPALAENQKDIKNDSLKKAMQTFNEFTAWLALPKKIQNKIYFIIRLYKDKDVMEKDTSAPLCTAHAYYDIGHAYFTKSNSSQDLNNAHRYFQQAYIGYQKLAKEGYFEALYMMGYLYEKGLGIKQDNDTAIFWYKKAILSIKNETYKKFGYPAQCKLANIYVKQKHYKLAIDQLKNAIKDHDPEAYSILGYCYQYGLGVEKNIKIASTCYEKVFSSLSTTFSIPEYYMNAKFNYALLLEEEKDYENSAKHYMYLAQQANMAQAHYQLGQLYERGLGVPESKEKALQAYHLAALQKEPRAMIAKAKLYEKLKNYEMAATLYQEVTRLSDHTEARFRLGTLYESGQGVKQNLQTAIEYYELAAGQEYADATFQLAQIYEKNSKSDKINSKNWQKKANNSYLDAYKQYSNLIEHPIEAAHAYFRLALMLQFGKGNHVNYPLALQYYQKAKELGYKIAADQIKLIQLNQGRKKLSNKNKMEPKKISPQQENEEDKTEQDTKTTDAPTQKLPTPNQVIQEFSSLILKKKFDEALNYIQQESIATVFKKNVLDEVKYLWAIADGISEKFQHCKNTEKISSTLSHQAQEAFNEVIQFAKNALKNISATSPDYTQFQSIINLAELERDNIYPHKLELSNVIATHEHQTASLPAQTTPIEKEIPAESKPQPIIYRHTFPLNDNANAILKTLTQVGAIAMIHGGYIRDYYLIDQYHYTLDINDVDIITDFPPEKIAGLFPNRSEVIGNRFPIVIVTCDNGEIIQIATFRDHTVTNNNLLQFNESGMIIKNSAYGNLYSDFNLHDFTINALYYHPNEAIILDFVGGLTDLESKLIRFTNKDPVESIKEDPLRILRGIRFAAKLNFSLEPSAKNAMKTQRHLLSQVHPARLYLETIKLFHPRCALQSFRLMKSFNLLSFILGSNADYLDKQQHQMIEILLQENSNLNGEQPSTHYDFIMSALLLSAINAQLARHKLIPYLAIDRVLAELQHVIYLPEEVSQSIKTILLLHLLPQHIMITSNKMKMHLYKATLLREWIVNADKKIASKSVSKHGKLLPRFSLIQENQKKSPPYPTSLQMNSQEKSFFNMRSD